MGWFVYSVGSPIILMLAYVLAIPMKLLPKQNPIRLNLAIFLEYLKSWLKSWDAPDTTINKIDSTFTGRKRYEDLLPREKLKVLKSYQRRRRLPNLYRNLV